MIVLDASVLIAFLDAEDLHHDRALTLLAGHADEELAASTLTLAEVLVGPLRGRRVEPTLTAFADIGVRAVPLSDDPLPLAALRVRTGLRMPDCCVLEAARTTGAAAVATFDARLAAAAEAEGLVATQE